MNTVSEPWRTGSKTHGHPKTRASLLILPAGNHSVAHSRGNSEDSQGGKAPKPKYKRGGTLVLCSSPKVNPQIHFVIQYHQQKVFSFIVLRVLTQFPPNILQILAY